MPKPKASSQYHPFGMLLVGRIWEAGSGYRFGFNGKESDPEQYGNGNIYDYGFRIYNPRLGKFLSVDPLTSNYPWYTPYQFAGNKPIWATDLDGLEEIIYTAGFTIVNNLLKVLNSSTILNEIFKGVSDPSKSANTKVYFTQVDLYKSQGLTMDMLGGFGLEFINKSKEYYGKSTLTIEDFTTDFEREVFHNFIENLAAMGLTLEQLEAMKAENPSLMIYAVSIDKTFAEEQISKGKIGVARVLKSVFHEVDFHLTLRLQGIKPDDVKEHSDKFGYKEYEEYYKEKGWNPANGSSPDPSIVPLDTPAGKIFHEIDTAVEGLD